MTRYTVIWLQRSLDQLAQIWLEAHDRPEVTAASAAIDSELADEPARKGKEESEGLRRLRVPPLTILFGVREPDRMVEVVAVKRIRDPLNGAPP
jgi:hypothetical protein